MNNRGDFGVGSLIIFIAMILVGAIAAGVLIFTTDSAQMKTYEVAEGSQDEMLRSAFIQEVSGTDARDGTVENLTITSRLVGGSQPLQLRDIVVEVAENNYDAYFVYRAPLNATHYCAESEAAPACATSAPNGGSGSFTVEYIKTARQSQRGVLMNGDTIKIHVPLQTSVREGEWLRVSIMPANGQKQYLEIHAPEQASGYIMHIYP